MQMKRKTCPGDETVVLAFQMAMQRNSASPLPHLSRAVHRSEENKIRLAPMKIICFWRERLKANLMSVREEEGETQRLGCSSPPLVNVQASQHSGGGTRIGGTTVGQHEESKA